MREIKAKISSTKKTRQITSAQHMVSAAKLNRAQQQAKGYQSYTDKLLEVMRNVAAGNQGSIRHPMLQTRPVKRTGYLVITADRGLAGAYNNNVLKHVQKLINERHTSKEEYDVVVVGTKGLKYFQSREMPVAFHATNVPDQPSFEDIKELAKQAVSLFTKGQIDELYLVYNHFISAISNEVKAVKLLPLTDLEADGDNHVSTAYEYEPSPEDVLDTLLPLYTEGLVYGAILDAKATEHASRMTAMKSSTDKANELIADYTLSYNRARQAAITQEISEIVGGANALQ